MDFVAKLLRALEQRGWPHRSDIGWSEFDAEIFGNRWSHVQLITAAEDHPRGRQLIRCRLRARGSMQATAAMWLLLALEVIIVGFFGGWLWALGAVTVTLPACAYFLSRQKRKIQSQLISFLDELAKGLQLIKIPTDQMVEPPAAPPAAKSKPEPMRRGTAETCRNRPTPGRQRGFCDLAKASASFDVTSVRFVV